MRQILALEVHTMTNGKLALLRLAKREFEGISASAEMFISNAHNHSEADAEIWDLLKKIGAIQEKSDKILNKLYGKTKPYEDIQIKEIY
jgi:hypothetical protein